MLLLTSFFVSRLPDPDVLTSNLSSFPIVGEAEIIDISFTDGTQNPTRIRIQCTTEPGSLKQAFKLVEVGCRMTKDMTYDCLHLGRCVHLTVCTLKAGPTYIYYVCPGILVVDII